ncbi:MAG: hypothetical protein AAF943_15755 [Pseudomonadota bacterium]
MDRKTFFAELRKRESGVFGTSLTQGQVEGCEAILNECVRQGADLGQAAYILATAYGESAFSMQPKHESLWYRANRIAQVFGAHRRQGKTPSELAGKPELLANTVYGGKWGRDNLGNTEPGDGWRFRGTGVGQITGRTNFRKFGDKLGLPLLQKPDLMMNLHTSVRALVEPMLDGWATGKKLSAYVAGDRRDYRSARRVWNGMFEADRYARYARSFEVALEAAGYESMTTAPAPDFVRPDPAPSPSQTVAKPSPWTALLNLILKFFRR